MAGVFIHITGNALPRLTQIANVSGNPADVLDDIGAFLDMDVTTRFLREVTPEGRKWEQSQAAKDRGGLTLTDERNLAGSVTHNVNGNTLEHGLGEKYAAINHYGGETGRNKSVTLPARPIAAVQENEINDIITDWLI
ncbi:phage virion morphogenesis protein [Pseudoalteromonas sp. TB51]|uniref:phage virion morphogenesis protein n=1 Tax=Pseudoalteromonas sp. TB51 TaxID=1055803 RepID=UPI0004A34682|nr:phage virion morphogenesis protein [Pseudoalteromonas sp. TB51]